MKLIPQPISQEVFQPYGDLIVKDSAEKSFGINYGNTVRHHNIGDIDTSEQGGRPIISIFESTPLSMPLKLEIMERHPLASQAFIPLSSNPYLVVVAEQGDFNPETLNVFIVNNGEGVNYKAGTWHHFCLALNTVSDFLVIDREGPGNNCDEINIAEYGLSIELN